MAGLEINTSSVILGSPDTLGVPQYTAQYQPGYFSISNESVVVTQLALTNALDLVVNSPSLLSVGQIVEAYGIQPNTTITQIYGNTITLSAHLTHNISSGTSLILGTITPPDNCALPALSAPLLDLGSPITPMDRACSFAFPNVNLVTPVYNAPNIAALACQTVQVKGNIVQTGAADGQITVTSSGNAPDCGILLGGNIHVTACENFKIDSNVKLTGSAQGSLTFGSVSSAPDCGAQLTGNIFVPQACEVIFVEKGNINFPPNMAGSAFNIYNKQSLTATTGPTGGGGGPPCTISYDLDLHVNACEAIKINPIFNPPSAFSGSTFLVKPKAITGPTSSTGPTASISSASYAQQQEENCSVDLKLDLVTNFCEAYKVFGTVTTSGMAQGNVKLSSSGNKGQCQLILDGNIEVPEILFDSDVQTHGLPWSVDVLRVPSAAGATHTPPHYQLKADFKLGDKLSSVLSGCWLPISVCVLGVTRDIYVWVVGYRGDKRCPGPTCCLLPSNPNDGRSPIEIYSGWYNGYAPA